MVKSRGNMLEDAFDTKQAPIKVLFSDQFLFHIPVYQRPFSWKEKHFDKLIEDLIYSYNEEILCFLGSIVLIKKKNENNYYSVVDGQQRLTSMAILLAVFRDIFAKKEKSAEDKKKKEEYKDKKDLIKKLLYQPKTVLLNNPESMRIEPWESLKGFFIEYLYNENGIFKLLKDIKGKRILVIEKSQQENIITAINIFLERLEGLSPEELISFAAFVLNYVYMVYITTNDQNSAYRLFNVLNTRGLSLSNADLIKNMNLEKLRGKVKINDYALKWRILEENLTRDGLEDLIGFIRTMLVKEKAKGSILDEFQDKVFKKHKKLGEVFLNFLGEIGEIYQNLMIDGEINLNSNSNRNYYKSLMSLLINQLKSSEWKALFLYFCYKFQNPEQQFIFLKLLEAKILINSVMRLSFTKRVLQNNKYLKLIDQEKPSIIFEEISNYVKKNINHLQNIRNDEKFYRKDYSKYILLKIDLDRTNLDSTIKLFNQKTSIEHILPQKPSDEYWTTRFTTSERNSWTNKIGNLVILGRNKNSQASNFPFPIKKEMYFFKDDKSTPYIITQDLRKIDDWNLVEIDNRNERIVDTLLKNYNFINEFL